MPAVAAGARAASPAAPAAGAAPPATASSAVSETSAAAEALYKVPQFAKLGPLFRSSKSVRLTESESEYVVTCVKHIFSEHVVFQFTCTNTLDDLLLVSFSISSCSTCV